MPKCEYIEREIKRVEGFMISQFLTIEDARILLSGNNNPPLKVLCKDFSNNLLYLGLKSENNGTKSLFDILNNGIVSRADGTIPTWETLVNTFRKASGGQECKSAHVLVVYDILCDTLVKSSNHESSTISMLLEYPTTNVEPFSKPPQSATAKLKIKIISSKYDNENYSSSKILRNQLELLCKFDEMSSMETPISHGSHSKDILSNFLANMSDGFQRAAADVELQGQNVDDTIHHYYQSRVDLDFTERLWDFITEMETHEFNDVPFIVQSILDETTSKTFQPQVNKKNTTALANLIRDISKLHRSNLTPTEMTQTKRDVLNMVEFWKSSVWELLVEIGVWKLRRDILHVLVGESVVGEHQIRNLLDASLTLSNQVQNLRLLLRILDVYSLIRQNLVSMPKNVTVNCINDFIKASVNKDVDETITLDVNLPCTMPCYRMVDILSQSFEPSLWKIELKSDYFIQSSTFDRKDELFGKGTGISMEELERRVEECPEELEFLFMNDEDHYRWTIETTDLYI